MFQRPVETKTSVEAISRFLCLWFMMSCAISFALQRTFKPLSLCASLPYA